MIKHPLLPVLLLAAAPGWTQTPAGPEPGARVSLVEAASLGRGLVGLEALDGDSFVGAGSSFKVAFEPGGVEVTPFLGSAAPYNVTLGFELESAHLGARTLLAVDEPARPVREGDDVVYRHGRAVVERYELRRAGVYQSFDFLALPEGGGDLVVRGRLTTAPGVVHSANADGGLTFELPGVGGLVYGAVLGVDAGGRTFEGSLRLADGTLELVLPAHEVAAAQLPLTLDPLIGDAFSVNLNLNDEGDPDVAYSPTLNRSLVVWERTVSFSDLDVYGIQVQNGAPTGTLRLIETGAGLGSNPSVGFVPQTSRFLVAYQFAPSGLSDPDILGRPVASNGTVGPVITIAATANNERDPDVGGENSDVDDEALVVWEEDGVGIRATQVRITSGDETQVGAVPTLSEVGTGIRFPAISKTPDSNGHFLIVWEQDVGNLTKIFARSMNRNAVITSGVDVVSDPIGLDILSDSNPDVDTTDDAWIVVWQENESAAGTDHDVEGVRVEKTGATLGTTSTVFEFENDPGDDEIKPCIANTGQSLTVVFLDEAGSEYDLYLKCLDPYTVRPGPEVLVENSNEGTLEVEIASRWGGGATGSDESLIVWDSQDVLFDELVRARVHVAPDNVTRLGGDCGDGGETWAPCPYEGNQNFRVHLRGATPGALAILAVSPQTVAFDCGPCTVYPRLTTAQLYVVGATSPDGNANVLFPVPDPFGPATFTAQWGVFNGGGCGFFGGFDLSNGLEIDITAP